MVVYTFTLNTEEIGVVYFTGALLGLVKLHFDESSNTFGQLANWGCHFPSQLI
jgi:hypothetical protein